MAEVHSTLLDFFIAQLGSVGSLAKYRKRGEWLPVRVISEFTEAMKKKGRAYLLLRQAGQDFAAQLRAEGTFGDDLSFDEAVSLLPKTFIRYIRGDGSGIIKLESVGSGFVRVLENTPFPCSFTEGVFLGFLQGAGARGAMVHQILCREEDPKEIFCVYELKWMCANRIQPK
ncbi:MAG: hypothetical protein LBC99_03300 [Spirochaetota bacterium]|jgi:hypothetical protein|nr:hypothetical protein [Spirochaetota bacterium]